MAFDSVMVATTLTATPTAATTINVPPCTATGCTSRSTASMATSTETTSSVMPLPTAARISARFMPNVCEPVSGRWARRSATSDPAMAPMSASMCPASASSARECERNAVTTSNAMKAARRTRVTVKYLGRTPTTPWA